MLSFQASETEVTASAASQLPLSTQAQWSTVECNVELWEFCHTQVTKIEPHGLLQDASWTAWALHLFAQNDQTKSICSFAHLHFATTWPRLVSLAQLPWDESAFLRLASASDWANKRTHSRSFTCHREERRVHRLLRLTIRKVLMAWSSWRVLCGSLISNQVRQVTVEVWLKSVWKSIACRELSKAACFQHRWPIRGKDHEALIL